MIYAIYSIAKDDGYEDQYQHYGTDAVCVIPHSAGQCQRHVLAIKHAANGCIAFTHYRLYWGPSLAKAELLSPLYFHCLPQTMSTGWLDGLFGAFEGAPAIHASV